MTACHHRIARNVDGTIPKILLTPSNIAYQFKFKSKRTSIRDRFGIASGPQHVLQEASTFLPYGGDVKVEDAFKIIEEYKVKVDAVRTTQVRHRS